MLVAVFSLTEPVGARWSMCWPPIFNWGKKTDPKSMIKRPPVKLKRALRKTKLKEPFTESAAPVVVKADAPSKNESIIFEVPDKKKGSPPIKEREIHNTAMNKKPSLILRWGTLFGVAASKRIPREREMKGGKAKDTK